jgi:uncharacterized protein YfiM (DUF2279 family)
MPIILAFAFSLHGSQQFGVAPDKLKHFFLSAFVQSTSYSALRLVRVEHDAALIGASGVTVSVGVAKEVLDHRAGGRFDRLDLFWDVAGGATAAVMLEHARP